MSDPARLRTGGSLRSWEGASLPLAVLVLALATLVPGFWVPSLWTDEAATASAVRRSWPELLFMLGKVDAVHGLYYVLVKSLTDVVGVSEVSLRLPSVAAGAAAAVVMAVAGRRLGGARFGLAAAVVLVFLPRFQFAATDARSYSLTILTSAACALFVVRLREAGRRSDALAFGALLAVSTGLSFYCVLLAPVALCAAAADSGLRAHWRKLVAASLPAMALAAWIASVASGQKFQVAWIPPLDLHVAREMIFLQYFSHAAMWTDSGIIPTPDARLVVGMAVTAALTLGLGVWGVIRRPRSFATVFGLALVLVPPTAVVAGSLLLGSSYYLPRYLAFTMPGLCLLAANGVVALAGARQTRFVAAAAAVALAAGGVVAISGQRTEFGRSPEDDFRFIAQTVRDHSRPGEAFAVGAGEDLFLSAYPAPFEGLVDITRGITAAEWGLIFNQRFPIDSRSDLIDRQRVVWSISLNGKNAQAEFLHSRGFVEVRRWTGPGHTVAEFAKP